MEQERQYTNWDAGEPELMRQHAERESRRYEHHESQTSSDSDRRRRGTLDAGEPELMRQHAERESERRRQRETQPSPASDSRPIRVSRPNPFGKLVTAFKNSLRKR